MISTKSRIMSMSCFVLLLTTTVEAKDSLFLNVGEQQLISQGKKIKRLAVGNAKIIQVKSLKNDHELLITGKTAGSTDLIIWYERSKKTFEVQVLANNSQELLATVRSLLRNIEGVTIRRVGQELWLEGEILRPADKLYLYNLTRGSSKIRDLTHMHSNAIKVTVQLMQNELKRAGFQQIKITTAGDTFYIEGSVADATALKKIKNILQPIYPKLEFQVDSRFGGGDMILLDIKMVEMRKNALKNLGIQWQKVATGNFSGQISTQGSQASGQTAEAIPVSINTLEQKGLARILANPKLTCKFNVACKFMAGGEVPIPLIGERVVEVIYKTYGILLTLTARSAQDDRLLIDIDSEFSDINYATAVQGLPGFLKNKVKTSAAVRYNQSVVLSGLVTAKQSKNVDKLPVLGSVPILGELFKSRSFNRDESEFLLFLTPYSIMADDRRSQEMMDASQKKYNAMEKHLGYEILD